jgi:hypothetical protein
MALTHFRVGCPAALEAKNKRKRTEIKIGVGRFMLVWFFDEQGIINLRGQP